MDKTSGFAIGGVSFLGGGKSAERFSFAVDPDGRTPHTFFLIPCDALDAGPAVASALSVHGIFAWRGQPKVRDAVVPAIVIDMVKRSVRPFAINVEPRKAMR